MSALKQTVDERSVDLVFGYVRGTKITDKIVPSPIIYLILRFYYTKLTIICLQEDNNAPLINIAQIDTEQNCQCKITHQTNTYLQQHKVNFNAGLCGVKNFKIPRNLLTGILKKALHDTAYDIVFLFGGGPGAVGSRECHCYIFNSNKSYESMSLNKEIDAYYWQLPSFTSAVEGPYAEYSPKHGLIAMGNLDARSIDFNVLKFNDDINIDEWKWQNIGMNRLRKTPAAVMINDDQIVCTGGYPADCYKYVDLYDFNERKWKQLCDMMTPKRNHGICADKAVSKRVYIGGGSINEKSFECYDINKNQWYRLKDTSNSHKYHPIIWIEGSNIINIASSYTQIFERMDLRENKVWQTYIGTGDNKTFKDAFGRNVPASNIRTRLCKLN